MIRIHDGTKLRKTVSAQCETEFATTWQPPHLTYVGTSAKRSVLPDRQVANLAFTISTVRTSEIHEREKRWHGSVSNHLF